MYEIAEFEDSEAAFIKALDKSFKQLNILNVRVAAAKLPDHMTSAEIPEVIVRSTSRIVERAKVEENFTIYIFCTNENENVAFKQANDLTRWTTTAMRKVITNSTLFRAVTNISSSPFEDEGETQIRSVLATVVSYGSRKRIKR